MYMKPREFIVCTLMFLLVVSYADSLSRVRRFTSEKRWTYEILDFIGFVEQQGRTAEWHNVTTDDGYILTLFRIPPNPLLHNKSHIGSPVYLQHALGTSAEMFVSFDSANSLAYILSDAGYDVWLGNVRGTVYSDKHETLSTDQPQFWDFSLDEAALIDVPAMIDYILETTGKSKLSYVGYSLGSTLSAILLSNRTEYNDKMNLLIHISHATFHRYPNLIKMATVVGGEFFRSAGMDCTFDIFYIPELVYLLFKYICGSNPFIHEICKFSCKLVLGQTYEEEKILPLILRIISGASAKFVLHYWQFISSGNFQYFDHGNAEVNMLHYGKTQPPPYNLSNIAVPLLIFHGASDGVTVLEDVLVFISELRPTTKVILKPIKNFSHFDFVTAKNVKCLVYDDLLRFLSNFTNNH